MFGAATVLIVDFAFLNIIDFFMKGKLVKTKSILWRTHIRIHRYVAAPTTDPEYHYREVQYWYAFCSVGREGFLPYM